MLVFTFLQSTTHLGDRWLCLIERNSMIPAVFSLTFTRGYSTKFYAGRLHRPMYTIFDGKGTPVGGIHIPSIDKWYSFHELFTELCIPINWCKWTVFKIWINHKTRMFFSTISQPKKFICKPFWFFFTDRNHRFPYPLIYFNKWNPDTFIYLKPEIGTPLERSLPLWAIIGSTPGDLYASVLPAHPADQTVFSTSNTCNLPGRECVLFPMKNVSSSDVVMKGLGLRSLTQAGFPRVLSRSRFAQHVYKFLYVNTEVALNFPFSIGRNTLQLRPFFRSCSNFQIFLLTIIGRGSWKLHTDVCCK